MSRAETIYDRSVPGRGRGRVPDPGTEALGDLPGGLLRTAPPELPEVDELTLMRHYTGLSHDTYAITRGFYPLGSCTMKYNPPLNDQLAAQPGFSGLHPDAPEACVQGMLGLMWELERALAGIVGLSRVTLQPAAGAQGEFCGLLLIRALHRARGRSPSYVVVPDSAHGTNPASATLAGYGVKVVRSDAEGLVDIGHLREIVDGDCAGLMLTNPNTLGLFDRNIGEISAVIHDAGGMVYMDGANLNALLGIARPGDMGVDVLHLNLHKTFSTPHGGGGPGAGPVAVAEALVPFLPRPTVERSKDGSFWLDYGRPDAIGRLHAFHGNVGVLVRAYAYILTLGADGLERVSRASILSANYLKARLKGVFPLAYGGPCMHEFVLTLKGLRERGLHAWDVAKRLMDFGVHPPTVGFPINVSEALMIETPETEPLEMVDRFADALIEIAREAENDPELVGTAPHATRLGRLDEARAVRQPDLCWSPPLSDAGGEERRQGDRRAAERRHAERREEDATVLEVFTDGACSGNPGPGGYGALLRAGGKEKEICGYSPSTTNNRMEMLAAIRALEAVNGSRQVALTTDSKYLRDGITGWIHKWKRNGWKTAAGKPVKNADLWRLLDELATRHRVTWHWVEGHAGHPENERADRLARDGILRGQKGALRPDALGPGA